MDAGHQCQPARDYGLMSKSCACRLYKLPLAALSNAATDSARFGRTFGDPNTGFNNRDTTDYPPLTTHLLYYLSLQTMQ
jgi:hypothetical protein